MSGCICGGYEDDEGSLFHEARCPESHPRPDATATKSPLNTFGELGDRLRCGECGRLTIPRRPTFAELAAFLDEVPERDTCGTCAFVWVHCAFVVAGETLAGRAGDA